MKNYKIILSSLLLVAIIMFAGCSNSKTNNINKPGTTPGPQVGSNSTNQQVVAGKDTDGDGIPDTVEKIYGTNPYNPDTDGDGIPDKVDKDPTFAENPIKETSTQKLPVTIKDSRVEDNTTTDHLEITFTNTGKEELKNFDIYYTITDDITSKKEAYYQKLNGLSIKPGETKAIHFDNKSEAGHYFGNMNGLYGTSKNGLTFDVSLHNTNYQPLNFKVKKAKGTAEVAD